MGSEQDDDTQGARAFGRTARGRRALAAPARAPSPSQKMLVDVTELGELVARHVAEALRPPKLLLTVREVSLALSLGESTIWALVRAGRMPAPIRLSTGNGKEERGRRLWIAEQLEAWARNGCPGIEGKQP